MEMTLLLGLAASLFSIIVALIFMQRNKQTEGEQKIQQQQRGVPQRAQDGVPRRAQIVRNQRNRLRNNAAPVAEAAAAAVRNDSDEDSDQGEIAHGQVLDEKMGAKKRAKMEAKEQKRLMREQELKLREERKAKEAKQDLERKELEEREAEVERKQAVAEKLAREEQERKDHEEYLKMKAAFSVEEEGYEDGGDDENENLLAEFIKYVKDNKVVVLEDLATEFKLKTQQAIERIQELQSNGTITGVIDDRGKFIYISEEELQSVAKFIRQRGRVSITELAECSNNLINLTPVAIN